MVATGESNRVIVRESEELVTHVLSFTLTACRNYIYCNKA
jgi:hypothetical protein